jgi:hypothetical protein
MKPSRTSLAPPVFTEQAESSEKYSGFSVVIFDTTQKSKRR